MNIVLLSGDRLSKTRQVAEELGVNNTTQSNCPIKTRGRGKLSAQLPTAMVGDGINDAPALAKATLGVSLSNASQAAIQSAQIILLNGNLQRLADAVAISKATLQTIKKPVLGVRLQRGGHPHRRIRVSQSQGALFMAFSDVVVIGNSIRLKYRKVG
ncbi:MAG: HAD family hydrolase [Saprospirales bacterium]|nr:HAD family hydrolase [Saprospirales bacterium]